MAQPLYFFVVIFLAIGFAVFASHLGPYDDNIIYTFKWPGRDNNVELLADIPENNVVTMLTPNKEKYNCVMPNVDINNKDSKDSYSGPTGFELITPLFLQSTCAYRFETYWTYEICHGKYIRQYHEERDKKVISIQEYYLGRWDITKTNQYGKMIRKIEENVPSKKIESLTVPYLQLNYTNGTLCDLNSQPRQTNVLYMCYETGRQDFFSIKEIATCHYEIIMFSSLLCSHPKYKPITIIENEIKCIPGENTAIKPKELLKMEALQMKSKLDLLNAIKPGEMVRFEIVPAKTTKEPKEIVNSNRFKSSSRPIPEINQFLSGEECVHGGNDWWKYKFCYGKHVLQYHVDKDKSTTTIITGKFDLEAHKNWLKNNPRKKSSESVSHFYSNGDRCGPNLVPRETEVRFKCASDSAISLFFSEPETCKYILEIHSQMICELLNNMDEYGLFKIVPDEL